MKKTVSIAFVVIISISAVFAIDPPERYAFLSGKYALSDHNGHKISDETFKGKKIMLIYFGYTTCPDFCPLTLAKIKSLYSELGKDSSKVQTLMITIDPETDTPNKMKKYVTFFDPTFLAATGTDEEIKKAAAGFGVVYFPLEEEAGKFYGHTDRVFLVDKEGRIRGRYDAGQEYPKLVKDVEYLVSK